MKLIDQILPQIVNANESILYKILSMVGRKKRREALSAIKKVVYGDSDLLKSQPKEVRDNIKEKFNKILDHYDAG